MESLKIIEFLEKCDHIRSFKRVKPMIVRMVDLRCDAEKVGAYRFKLYPDVAKLDLLARHLYLFMIQTYIQPSFLKRDFEVLALVMGIDESLVREIFLSIRGAPYSSDFRSEKDLLIAVSMPIVRELKLAENLNIDSEHGLMQWISGYLILNPKILEIWDSPELEENLLTILEKNSVKYLGNLTPVHEAGLIKLREIQRRVIENRKNNCEESNLEVDKVENKEDARVTEEKKLIFNYPVERGVACWLSIATYGGFLFFFLIFDYVLLGSILSLFPSYWIFKTSIHHKRLIFFSREEFELHRNGERFKLGLSDILRVERFQKTEFQGIRLVFRETNLEPLEIYSNFDQYQTLLNYLQNSDISDRILSPAECFNIG